MFKNCWLLLERVRVMVNNDADPDCIRPTTETCTAPLIAQETFKPRKRSLPRVSGLCARLPLRAWSRQLTPGSAAAGLPLPHQTASSSWSSPVTLRPSKAPSLSMCGTDGTGESGYFMLRHIGAKQISCSNSGVPKSSPRQSSRDFCPTRQRTGIPLCLEVAFFCLV